MIKERNIIKHKHQITTRPELAAGQINPNFKIPMTEGLSHWKLVLGDYLLFGYWCLKFSQFDNSIFIFS
jgi:hypothetical protein